MKTCFVDTNLFIRYLTNDDQKTADRVENLLKDASAGKLKLVTTEMVIAEIVWVLESSYDMKPKDIAPMIKGILSTPGLEVLNEANVKRAVQLYNDFNVDFIDAYIAAVMEIRNINELYSFDRKHISRLSGITRIEP
jgi:predicted nucleic-acid-binding protein